MAQKQKLAGQVDRRIRVKFIRAHSGWRLSVGCLMVIGSLLVGCDMVGPAALEQSRPDYNEVIRQTAKNQFFLNLVRVHCHEPPLFMDVSEVDVALQFQGSINGTVNFPQARALSGSSSYLPGHDYLLGGTLQYLETPTIRYLPLSGQALFAQISAPISVDSIAAMIDSQWPVSAVLELAVTRLTPVDKDYYEALDAMIFLNNYNALQIVPVHADPASGGGDDALKLYFMMGALRNNKGELDPTIAQRAKYVWHRLWEIYGPSQPANVQEHDYCIELRTAPRLPQAERREVETTKTEYYLTAEPAGAVKRETTQWGPGETTPPEPDHAATEPAEENAAYNVGANDVSSALHQSKYPPKLRPYQQMPTLRMRSALGILRELTQPDLAWDLVTFIQADSKESGPEVENVRSMIKKFNADCRGGIERDYYIFDSRSLTGRKNKPSKGDASRYEKPWANPPSEWPPDDFPPPQTPPNQAYLGVQDHYAENDYPERGDRYRHYMIVFYQDANKRPPRDAYVSAVCHGQCFYIDGDDVVSQRNFALVCHFLTIQAVPQSAPLTPTIGVGATH
jgi:hypothetical protein